MMVTAALVRDTFREAIARKIFWGLFGLSTAMILFLLFILKIDIVEGGVAVVQMIWGGNSATPDADRFVRNAYAGIATFLYTFGMFLAVFASSGLTPNLLEPGRIELLLSKPVSRPHLLLGRYAGNLLVVALNTTWLVLGVWLILGWKTGIWSPAFLVTIPATVFLFAVLLAVVVVVGVAFESAALATMVTVALMIVSPILAQERTMMKLLSSEWSRQLWKGLYYVLPKTFDVGRITLFYIRDRDPGILWMPLWTSAAFAAACLGLALWLFARRDY